MAHSKIRGPWPVSRRAFLSSAAACGVGLALGYRLTRKGPIWFDDATAEREVFNWVVFDAENTVTVRVAQMELGQGAITAMCQLLGEELDLAWSQIRPEFISIRRHVRANHLYGRTETDSSLGVRLAEPLLRVVGAQIRSMLLSAASVRFEIPAASLSTSEGFVVAGDGRRFSYADLASDAARVLPPTDSGLGVCAAETRVGRA